MFRLKQMFFFALVIFSFSSLAATVFPVNQEILKLPVKDSLTGKYFDYSIQLHRTTPFYKVYKITQVLQFVFLLNIMMQF